MAQKICQGESKTPAFSLWKPWQGEIEKGHFYTDDIDSIRITLLQQGISPRLSMKDRHEIRQLTIGKTIIHTVPTNLDSILAFVEKLKVHGITLDYKGEGLPAITSRALTALLQRSNQRIYLCEQEKTDLINSQNGKCAICGDALTSRIEFDHIVRLSIGTGEQKFQALHANCHAAKTTDEEKRLDDDPLTSHFSKCTWAKFCDAPALQALTFCAKEVQEIAQNALILDVRRCRKRALEFCADALPAFSPLDNVVEVNDFELGDFVFVDAPYTTFIRQYGYTGPGWIHKCLAR